MDLLHFLKSKLRFIEQLYDGAAAPFVETKRQIEAGEPPYVDNRNPEYADGEPAFLQEWQDADESVLVLGYWCLCSVQASLQTYLREYIGPCGAYWWKPERLRSEFRKKRGNWFERYRLLFREDLGIDWSTGPVSLDQLEQLNLTRDDLNHNVDLLSVTIARSKTHARRFPDGIFTDESWVLDRFGMERLNVDKEKLLLATRLVEEFCTWLEGIRCRYPQYVKEMHGIDLRRAG
jgi:hypothetical protein